MESLRGQEVALTLRSQHGIRGILGDCSLDDIMSGAGLSVEQRTFRSGLAEVVVDQTVVLGSGLTHPWQRWLKAHALGHNLLHAGNQVEMPALMAGQQERQAEEFAGWLIFGPLPFGLRECTIDARILAEWGEVPVECVRHWWLIVSEKGITV